MATHEISAPRRGIAFLSFQLLLLATIALGPAPSAEAESLTLTKTLSPKQQAAAAAFWTRERIAAAPALQLPVDIELGKTDPVSQAEEVGIDEPMGSTEPGSADPDALFLARVAYAQDWIAAEEEESAPELPGEGEQKGTAATYTTYDVNTNVPLWQIYPHRWSGRLTFTTPSGTSGCSATAISGNNIVTAAHCVYDTTNNAFYSNWVFTPAFRNGATPHGTFTAQSCSVLTSWVNLTGNFALNTWARHDVAVCTMNRNSSGQTLNAAVGFAGRLWNAGSNQLAFVNGYPGRLYTDVVIANGSGQYLRSCTAETFSFATDTLGAGCNWGRGISGGSWLVNYRPFQTSGQVNSVTSGLFIGQQNVYGARFTSNNIVVLCNVRGC
jgi:V8-like Glu-specific endopeptidase